MNIQKCTLSLALLTFGTPLIAADEVIESYDFSYKSNFSVTSYETDLALLPQFDVSTQSNEITFDRRESYAAKVSVNQSIETQKQKKVYFNKSASMTWQPNYIAQPKSTQLSTLYNFPVKRERIPVYYEGEKRVLDRVVLQGKNGQLYFTQKFGQTPNANIHFPSSKLQYKLASQNGQMLSNGNLNYRKSDPFNAAKRGYIVKVSLNSKVGEQFVVAPSLLLSGSHTAQLSTGNARSGSHGGNGRGGASYSSSVLSSVAGAFAGGSGGDGSNGGDGRRGGDGGDGSNAKNVGSIKVTIKPFSSPFYQQNLKDYAYRSNQGSGHLLFEQNQKVYIAAVGGKGGVGGNGGDGGDGGNGEAGSAGRKGSNASAYGSAGSGGTGGDGGDGGDGGRGGNGGDGGDGGNGGYIQVSLSGPASFKSAARSSFSAKVNGGSGGNSGQAGDGGSAGSRGGAGPGGPGGNSYYASNCTVDYSTGYSSCNPVSKPGGYQGGSGSYGRSGSSGSRGSSGSSGSYGSSGSIQFLNTGS